MARKKRVHSDKFECFYFTVGTWCREHSFEINRHQWEFAPGHHDERDRLLVSGELRGTTRRKFAHGEVHLLPSYVTRDQFNDEADRLGNVWVESGRLYASAWIPADAYFSLPSIFASVTFAGMTMRVRNLRYN